MTVAKQCSLAQLLAPFLLPLQDSLLDKHLNLANGISNSYQLKMVDQKDLLVVLLQMLTFPCPLKRFDDIKPYLKNGTKKEQRLLIFLSVFEFYQFRYVFYGDVVTESEKYRWMGPKRYDYVGTKVFMRHRSYEAEVAFAEVKHEETDDGEATNQSPKLFSPKKPRRVICRVNCSVCKSSKPLPYYRDITWKRSKWCFISIGAAIMSNRNEKAPDGLVADAHLADGFMHLISVKNCPRPFYLWHLLQLAKRDENP